MFNFSLYTVGTIQVFLTACITLKTIKGKRKNPSDTIINLEVLILWSMGPFERKVGTLMQNKVTFTKLG